MVDGSESARDGVGVTLPDVASADGAADTTDADADVNDLTSLSRLTNSSVPGVGS